MDNFDELTKFDIQAGAEKRQDTTSSILKGDFTKYILVLFDKKTKTILYYYGKDYFLDHFNGLRKSIVKDWRSYKKHFREGSYYRDLLEKAYKNENDYEYALFMPYPDTYSNIDYDVDIEDYLDIIYNFYDPMEYKRYVEIKYNEPMLFDMRNANL